MLEMCVSPDPRGWPVGLAGLHHVVAGGCGYADMWMAALFKYVWSLCVCVCAFGGGEMNINMSPYWQNESLVQNDLFVHWWSRTCPTDNQLNYFFVACLFVLQRASDFLRTKSVITILHTHQRAIGLVASYLFSHFSVISILLYIILILIVIATFQETSLVKCLTLPVTFLLLLQSNRHSTIFKLFCFLTMVEDGMLFEVLLSDKRDYLRFHRCLNLLGRRKVRVKICSWDAS